MKAQLLAHFIKTLALTPETELALNVCTFYQRPIRYYEVFLCGCSKQLKINKPRINKLCKRKDK